MRHLLLSAITGISFGLLAWAIFAIEKGLNPSTLARLERIKQKQNKSDKYTMSDKVNMVMQDTEYFIKGFGKIFKDIKFFAAIKKLLVLSDTKMYVDTFLFLSFICGLPFLLFLFTEFKIMALLAFPAFLIPTFYLKIKVDKRFLEFSKQFPDALNMMASSLRAGHPLFTAINIVTEEMPKPVSAVFETAKNDISLGIDLKTAFLNMTKNMPQSIDLKFFITAVLIQNEVGGNLAQLLDSLSNTIRERFKLAGQLRVQTAQTRISGIVLAIVPIAVLLIIFFLNPEYLKPLFETSDGKMAFALAIFFIVAGGAMMKKISNIEF